MTVGFKISFKNAGNKIAVLLCVICCLLLHVTAACQKYNFTNLGVEEGLVQSQPNDIVQDKYGSLWMATLGGISRYDGNSFYNYSESEGLTSHLAYKVYPAKNDMVWIGTEDGLQSFNGKSFATYLFTQKQEKQPIVDICEGRAGKIFALTNKYELYTVVNNLLQPGKIVAGKVFITTIKSDRDNNVFAAVYNNGIYKLVNNTWQLFIDAKQIGDKVIVKKLFFDNENNVWLVTSAGLYVYKQGSINKVLLNENIKVAFTCVNQDAKGHIWLGTSKGAYLLNAEGMPEYIGANAGLTDITINNIINDREGNVWFATDGEGIFRLSDIPFYVLSKQAGLGGNVVMGFDFKGKTTWAGSTDGGLVKQQGNSFIKVLLPSPKPEAQKINALFKDLKQHLWVGTLGGGLWKEEDAGSFAEVHTDKGLPVNYVIGIFEGNDGIIWVTSPTGLYYYDKSFLHKVNGFDDACFSVMATTPGAILIGSVTGLWTMTGKNSPVRVSIPGVAVNSVNCFAKMGDNILLGNGEKGIVYWNVQKGTALQCSEKDGLPSNFIFSLYVDSGNVIYAGTGHGISKITLDETTNAFTVKNYSFSNTVFGPECNLNAIKKNDDGNIWVGTTKGIIVYNPNNPQTANEAPLVFLDAVKLFSKTIPQQLSGDTVVAWHNIPGQLNLSYTQNHITFEFLGVYLTNPSGLRYKYMLQGNDTAYSEAVSVPKVIYSSLAPGSYHFKAFAIADNGRRSSNTIDFAFTIAAPFFQKTWFRLLAILLLIGAGVLAQYARTKIKANRAEAIRRLRLEEQQRIQQRTSEDLHDDLGNKISRITVLADVLDRKMIADDDEKRRLVKQIKENAQSLYLGTKDIIWSLTPGNDNLYDVLERCYNFGMNLFEDTDIEFKMEGQDDSFKNISLPVNINRNMVMIVKEALNNILKHSKAGVAIIKVKLEEHRLFTIVIADDGEGINRTAPKQGNGLGNIEKRVQRIGGSFGIGPNQSKGTALTTTFKIPPNEG